MIQLPDTLARDPVISARIAELGYCYAGQQVIRKAQQRAEQARAERKVIRESR